jgi:hypothetical protein
MNLDAARDLHGMWPAQAAYSGLAWTRQAS